MSFKINILVLFLVLTLVRPAIAETRQTTQILPGLLGRPVVAPYLYDGYSQQHQTWRGESWAVSDWAPDAQAARALLANFKELGVLRDDRPWLTGNHAMLVVDNGFYRLSTYDQRRLLGLVDQLYSVTGKRAGTLFLKDNQTDRVIGLYTAWGLQLQ